MINSKIYWLGGEPIMLSDEETELVWRRPEEQRKLVVKNVLKPSLKMGSIFCEFGGYDRKICVTKTNNLLFITLAQKVIKKWHTNN